jgi:CRISPR-associated protein Cas2
MMVLIVHKVRPSIRGRLTRWLIQPQSGVYVGHPSARIRDKIWEKVCEEVDLKGGAAVLIHPHTTEQGYRILTRGKTPKTMADFEGLVLPKTPKECN